MPLPFLALAGLGALGLVGAKKSYDAYCDNEDANKAICSPTFAFLLYF